MAVLGRRIDDFGVENFGGGGSAKGGSRGVRVVGWSILAGVVLHARDRGDAGYITHEPFSGLNLHGDFGFRRYTCEVERVPNCL